MQRGCCYILTPPPPYGQTGVKTLACPKLRLRAVIMKELECLAKTKHKISHRFSLGIALFITRSLILGERLSSEMTTDPAGTIKCDQYQRLTSVRPSSHVTSAFCICVKCQEWCLLQQAMVFTLSLYFEERDCKDQRKTQMQTRVNVPFNEQHCLCSYN